MGGLTCILFLRLVPANILVLVSVFSLKQPREKREKKEASTTTKMQIIVTLNKSVQCKPKTDRSTTYIVNSD